MSLRTARWLLLAAVFLTACARPAPDAGGLAYLLVAGRAGGAPLPTLSVTNPDLDEAEAYAIQREFVLRRLSGDGVAGFKAALTSPAAQALLSGSGPVSGVLFASGRRPDGAVIDGSALRRPVIETEIGYVLSRTIASPLDGPDELRRAVGAILPVIELPETGFRDLERVTSADLVAVNAGSAWFVVGEEAPPGLLDPNAVSVTLQRDGLEVGRGAGTDAMGDQWQAGLWLVNRTVEQGYTLRPGQLLITGAMGRPVPATPGHYVADYGRLGRLTLRIR